MASDDLTRLRQELDELKDRVKAFEKLLADDAEPNGRYPSRPQPSMHDLEDWVVNWLENTLERRASNTRRWCPEWYKHPEVVSRFWVLYHSHLEVERSGDAVAHSAWFVEHLDRHLDAIFNADGPFAGCSPERHNPHVGLRVRRNKHADRDWGPRIAPTELRAVPAIVPKTAEVNR